MHIYGYHDIVVVTVLRHRNYLGLLSPSFGILHVPSGTLKARPQEGGFKVRSCSGPLSLVSGMHGVFNNRDQASISRRQPRTVEIVFIFSESLGTLTNNSKAGFSYLVLDCLLDVLWCMVGRGRGTLLSQMGRFCLNHKCMHGVRGIF